MRYAKRKIWADFERLDKLAQRHGGMAIEITPIRYEFPSIEKADAFKRALAADSALYALFQASYDRRRTVTVLER